MKSTLWHLGKIFFNILKFSPRPGTHYFTYAASPLTPHAPSRVIPSSARQIACHGVNRFVAYVVPMAMFPQKYTRSLQFMIRWSTGLRSGSHRLCAATRLTVIHLPASTGVTANHGPPNSTPSTRMTVYYSTIQVG